MSTGLDYFLLKEWHSTLRFLIVESGGGEPAEIVKNLRDSCL
jgi:hypothetical protein